jgi:hypothetical protein
MRCGVREESKDFPKIEKELLNGQEVPHPGELKPILSSLGSKRFNDHVGPTLVSHFQLVVDEIKETHSRVTDLAHDLLSK